MTGRAIAVAALERTESRGSHYRDDYDRESEDLVQHIHVRLKEGVPRVSRVVPIET